VQVEEEVVMEEVVVEEEAAGLEEEEMRGLCEYERIRLRNIRQREALFAKLELQEAKEEAREAAGVAEPARREPRSREPRREAEEFGDEDGGSKSGGEDADSESEDGDSEDGDSEDSDSEDSKHMCIYCGKELRDKTDLKRHMDSLHREGVVNYKCTKSFCDLEFGTQWEMELHRRDCRWQCPQCTYTTAKTYNCDRHRRKHS
jgi:hypothetical protein